MQAPLAIIVPLMPIVTIPGAYFHKTNVIDVGSNEKFWLLLRPPNQGIINSSPLFETGEATALEITVRLFDTNHHSHNFLLAFAERQF